MKKFGVMFPGQGSQYVGMGKKLYDRYDVVKKLYNRADEVLGYSIKDLCFEGGIKELTKTENTQPAILLAGVAAFNAMLEEIESRPAFIAGHSIGEITALTCAGAVDFEDALKIVYNRGKLMESIKDGAMAAVIGDIDCFKLDRLCKDLSKGDDYITVANYNSYNQVVISGKEKTIEKAQKILSEKGFRVVKLKVSSAFHSELMRPITEEFRNVLKNFEFNAFKSQVIRNVDAMPYKDKGDIEETLVKQLTSSVQWVKTLEYLRGQNLDCLVDLGPGKVVNNLAKRCDLDIKLFASEVDDKYINFLKEDKSLNNCTSVEFKHNPITLCIKTVVCTRNENKDNREYEDGVIPCYKELKNINEKLKNGNREPSKEEVVLGINLLKKILECKKVPKDEQYTRLKEIQSVTDKAYKLDDLFQI
ncbi:MAG: ACP S-malonyltransferase [Clostridium sp.]|jgi:[acyl-carrier-protein] S-malonyltransferase|nr:ACP S-malonyltransferase [Clostridium sp.]